MRRLCAAATRSSARAELFGEDRHFRGAAGHAREHPGREIEPREAREHDPGGVAQHDRKPRAGDEQRPRARDFAHDLRSEIERERRADDPLADLAPARQRRDGCARDAKERERQQRPQHPWNRRAHPREQEARARADREPADLTENSGPFHLHMPGPSPSHQSRDGTGKSFLGGRHRINESTSDN